MNRFYPYIEGLTVNSLNMLHDSIKRCLQEEDEMPEAQPKRYDVRGHSDFKLQIDAIEYEFDKREIAYNKIEW